LQIGQRQGLRFLGDLGLQFLDGLRHLDGRAWERLAIWPGLITPAFTRRFAIPDVAAQKAALTGQRAQPLRHHVVIGRARLWSGGRFRHRDLVAAARHHLAFFAAPRPRRHVEANQKSRPQRQRGASIIRRGPRAPLGRGRPSRDIAMLRLSMRWVDRWRINRPVGVGKPGHVVCAIAHPRVTREAEKGRCPADGATVNAFARSLRLGIIDLVSHRDLSLDEYPSRMRPGSSAADGGHWTNQPVAPYPRVGTSPRTTDHPDLEIGAVR